MSKSAAEQSAEPQPATNAAPNTSDSIGPRTLPDLPKSRKRIGTTELMVALIVIAIAVGVGAIINNKLTLRHEVADAKMVADKTVAAIQARNGATAYKLGTPTFRTSYTADKLTQQFKSVEIATLKKPTLIQEDYTDGNAGRNIFFMYEYTALKVPYYLRISVEHRNGNDWQLANIAGNADESQLIASN